MTITNTLLFSFNLLRSITPAPSPSHPSSILTYPPHLVNMSDATEAKPTPSADQTASSEPRLAEHETNLVKNPLGDPSSENPATESKTTVEAAASTVSAAATGVKDSVFSMFGGGVKKERKVEDDDDAKDEPSGSSKAKKAEDEEVNETLSS